jgi:hypothetical protein
MPAPWTEIGRLQSEVGDIKRDLFRKADSHEVRALNGRVDSIESSLQQIRIEVDGLLNRVQAMEDGRIAHT